MEQQIQDLVASIKRDGLESAKKESEKILSDAKAQAQKIVSDAQKKADKMIQDAQNECTLRDQSAKASLEQASRDVTLSLKANIEKQFGRILADSTGKVMHANALSSLITTVVKNSMLDASSTTVEVSTEDVKTVTEDLRVSLAKELAAGLEIKAVPSLHAGFHLAEKNGAWYVDLSAEESAKLLSPFISPALKEIIYK